MRARLCSVRAGGPAGRAGIKEGDELVAVEGVPVGTVAHWGQVLNALLGFVVVCTCG